MTSVKKGAIIEKNKILKVSGMKLLKSNVFWIVVFVLLTVLCVVFIVRGRKNDGTTAEIYIDGELNRVIELDSDREYEITTDYGVNIIEVRDGKIRVKSADCRNQVCVNTGWVETSDTPIICAPHRLSVQVCVGEKADVSV